MGTESERFNWENPFTYEEEQTCNIPSDQIYWLPSQLFYNVNVCLVLSDNTAWLFRTAQRQPKSNSLQAQVKAGLLVVSNWLLAVSFISSARECAMSKALLPLAEKSIFHLLSNGFLNKSRWFIHHCDFIHPLHLGHVISEPTAAISQGVTLWTLREEFSSELLVSILMPRKTHLQHRNHHTSAETSMNDFSGEKNESLRERPLKKNEVSRNPDLK